MQQQYILAAMGSNRPGVVADVTGAIYRAGCSIENSYMTLMGIHFTLMIHVIAEDEEKSEKLNKNLELLEHKDDLKVHVFPVESDEIEIFRAREDRPRYEIRVRGKDKSGIVYRTSKLLASRGINILKLSTKVDRSKHLQRPIFTMRIGIEVPKNIDGHSLRMDLESLAEDMQETITLTRKRD
ncbi:ACT domain-containing protein [Desulfonatronospira sp.]|uniref:glycine cleavage system protein R n=1 Tax=Desulfonatronospira sp. TaxID=1962951 RepID=UPI0025B83B52|nr:ACT domain-containing protein [Desulfonatronospira sp.]